MIASSSIRESKTMQYDTATVAMLRTVLDDLLVNRAFMDQTYVSSVDMAERVLRLARSGERDATVIKQKLLHELLTASKAA